MAARTNLAEALRAIHDGQTIDITVAALAEELGISVPAARRRIRQALEQGLIKACDTVPARSADNRGRPATTYELTTAGVTAACA